MVLGLDRQSDVPLDRLLGICNTAAAHLGQPRLYEDRLESSRAIDRESCFHISIAWTLETPGEPKQSMKGAAEKLETNILFDIVKVKMGNTVHDIPLA